MTMPFNNETLAQARHQELLREATTWRVANQVPRPSPRVRVRLATTLFRLATWLAADALEPEIQLKTA